MAERNNELAADQENAALKKLQAAAGFVDRSHVERLDWMYEQSAAHSAKPDNDRLMNMPVSGSKDQDMEDVKKLQESTAGALFLKSATKTTEDMKRKLREDPLFQIRQQEHAAKVNMLANPLIAAKMRKKEAKAAKKEQKKAEKAAKKEKKAAKKAAKKEKKAAKKASKKEKKASSSGSSSSDSSEGAPALAQPVVPAPAGEQARRSRSRKRSRSPGPGPAGRDDRLLGPSGVVVDKRQERAAQVAAQRDAALASRGAARQLSDEEKKRRIEDMRSDAARHEASKDKRIAAAVAKEKELEAADEKARNNSDQKYFREIREKAYMGNEGGTVADRLQNQRHRRQKHLNDPLEREG